ncbi:hypothetical protein [Microbulbifer yueqingensis]|uniref:Lipoprotein n=1 Tax=Microbulbifer yueqingensis TaxID=658219 RepID=A0A1G8XLE7_9GAMM|nr:hypothetical protein [Microbulbifer yueqingensis]SDJ91391.1 hypothetical protein SAMN05216212_1150 [Microbulbifer yueqingensis]
MERIASLACIGAIVLLAGCSSPRAQGAGVPAVIDPVTDASRAELQGAVSEALGNVPVTLSDSALTSSSLLVIEHSPPRDLRQPHLAGREMQAPVRFRLLLEAGECWLVRLPQGSPRLLEGVSCVPEAVGG